VPDRLAARLAAAVGTLGGGLSRFATRFVHLSNHGVLAVLCVTALAAVQHLWRVAKQPE
jgi:hypothetical protein